ncbi:MAG: hypothetical protein NC123_14240 [Butyrivibrio sp.]|nr:hypothetical protein [Acetatifactor muris]MCM1560682.1 hypothetical protein [Butyrivibrio sp.]
MKKNGIRVIAAVCAALGWWGLFYPGLTLTPDTVRIICEDEDGEEVLSEVPEAFDGELYLELLGTDPGSIRFRSRLLTGLNAFWEAFSWDKSTKN